MNDLFRFLIMRKPEPEPANASLQLATDTPLNGQLRQARSSSQPREAMQQVATQYLQSPLAVQSRASLKLGDGLAKFLAKLDSASTPDQQEALIEDSFGKSAAELAKSPDLAVDLQSLSDTLLALQLAPTPPSNIVNAGLTQLYRGLALVQQLASRTPVTNPRGGSILQRPLLLPANLFPLPTAREEQPPPPPPNPAAAEDQAALMKKAADLMDALTALSEVPAVQMANSPEPEAGTQRARLAEVHAGVQTATQRITRTAPSVGETGTMPFLLAQLPASARTTIAGVAAPVANLPIGPLRNTLRLEFSNTVSQISRQGIYRHFFPNWQPTAEPARHDDAGDPPPAVLAAPPNSHGTVAPAGIADLLVVRQHVTRYEPGEVAYVENVAGGEDFTRVSKRTRATQTTVTVAQTTSSSDERDTQATSRFDLNRQSNSVLQSDYSRVPGAPNSETYGALVQSGGSKTDASNTATDFGQDVTRRAASQITQQFQSQTVTQTSTSFEEDVTHHFDNSTGAADKVVVYQWLDKICQAQVFSYGKRLLYDVNVPEPGAFLLRSLARQQPDVLTLQRPLPFTLTADQLDDLNYLYYSAGYGATGVQGPPDLYKTVSWTWNFPPTAGDQPVINTTAATTITVPDGYSASKAMIIVYYVFWTDGGPSLNVTVGQRRLHFGGATDPGRQYTALDGETGSLPLTLLVDGSVFDCTIAVEILCTRTDANYANWQLRTHDTILQASRDRISEYESKWATLRAALQMLTFGQGAARKLQLQRMELQKAALAVLTNQQFDTLGAIEHSAQGYPQPFLPNVEPVGRYVRFLEQSFEWDQMMYLYYPYFWGRKAYWIDRVLVEDSDEAFGDFLRAGSARVIVPVRPGFEGVVGNFMATGTVPTTEELGQLTSAEYLPYLTELQGITDGPDTAQPYGDPWEIRLPTTLTVVRKDATLPRWKQETDAGGQITWVSDGSDPVG